MIAQELEVSLHMAFVEARQQRHEFITVEHLLLALSMLLMSVEQTAETTTTTGDADDDVGRTVRLRNGLEMPMFGCE